MELNERERKIDLNAMSPEELNNLSIQIGNKIRLICDETANKVNSILKIYGMSAKIAIAFEEILNESNRLEKDLKLELSTSKKHDRKPKQKQS